MVTHIYWERKGDLNLLTGDGVGYGFRCCDGYHRDGNDTCCCHMKQPHVHHKYSYQQRCMTLSDELVCKINQMNDIIHFPIPVVFVAADQ